MKRSAKALLKMGEQGIPGLLQKVQVSPQQIWELFFHFQLKLKKKKKGFVLPSAQILQRKADNTRGSASSLCQLVLIFKANTDINIGEHKLSNDSMLPDILLLKTYTTNISDGDLSFLLIRPAMGGGGVTVSKLARIYLWHFNAAID